MKTTKKEFLQRPDIEALIQQVASLVAQKPEKAAIILTGWLNKLYFTKKSLKKAS